MVDRPVTKEERDAKKRARERENQRLIKALTRFREVGLYLMSSGTAQANVAHLMNQHPDLMNELLEHLGTASNAERDVWEYQLAEKAWFPTQWNDEEMDQSSGYVDGMNLYPVASLIAEELMDKQLPKRHAAALANRVASEAEAQGKRGDYEWMNAVMLIGGSSSGVVRMNFNDRNDDIEFLVENRELIEPHLKSLLKRQTWDKDFVSDVINNEAPAMTDGVL